MVPDTPPPASTASDAPTTQGTDETTDTDATTSTTDEGPTDTTHAAERPGSEALESVVRLGLTVLGAATVLGLGLLLPGTDVVVVEPAVSIGDLVVATGTAGIVAALVAGAAASADARRRPTPGPGEVVASAAAIGALLVNFAAVLIAHRGLAPAIRPLLAPDWRYNRLFAVVALALLVAIAYRFWLARDPLGTAIAAWLAGPDGGPEAGDSRQH